MKADDIRVGDVFRRVNGETFTVGRMLDRDTLEWTNGTPRPKDTIANGDPRDPDYQYTLIRRKGCWTDVFGVMHNNKESQT